MTEKFLQEKFVKKKKIEKHCSKLKKVLFKVLFIQSYWNCICDPDVGGRTEEQYSEDLGPVRIFSYNCGKERSLKKLKGDEWNRKEHNMSYSKVNYVTLS